MIFTEQLGRFREKCERRLRDVFQACTEEVEQSVKEGSTLTGAPGQPVDTGNLKNSYNPRHLGIYDWQITTNVEYAEAIEEGIGPHGPLTLRSEVGGFHSLKLTRAAWQRIVEAKRREVAHD